MEKLTPEQIEKFENLESLIYDKIEAAREDDVDKYISTVKKISKIKKELGMK